MCPAAMPFDDPCEADPDRVKILIPEKVSPDGLALLGNTFDIHQPKSLKPEELLTLIPQYDALIIRSETKVTAQVLAAAKHLKVVARAGVGVDNIDVEAATKHGIIVVNSPSGNIAAAAEHTIALLMSVARNVPAGDRSFRSGEWSRSKLVGTEVGGKTLGIIGLGKVGLKVARMAIGLGMKVVAMDPYASPEIARTNSVTLVHTLPTLLPMVDFLTVHTPLMASTQNLISSDELQKMKPTAQVLNVARGGVYNEQALLDALDFGTIAGAGLDVFTSEPPAPGSAAQILVKHPKVVATPHLGASTIEAQENVSIDVCRQVLAILSGGLPSSAVNAPLILPEEHRKLQPFVKLVEKMGSLYTQHFGRISPTASLGGKKFEIIYEGELASIANTRPLFAALVKGLTSTISENRGRDVNIVNADLIAREKGIVINETHARSGREMVYASLITLKASSASTYLDSPERKQIITGYVSGNGGYISKLDRFDTNFVPEGRLLVLHNYDEPGKIGGVGSILGRNGINIRFMTVAGLGSGEVREAVGRVRGVMSSVMGNENGNGNRCGNGVGTGIGEEKKSEHEALMILGVDGVVSKDLEAQLRDEQGILDVSLVEL